MVDALLEQLPKDESVLRLVFFVCLQIIGSMWNAA